MPKQPPSRARIQLSPDIWPRTAPCPRAVAHSGACLQVVATCQIDLIGVPQPVSAERPMAAPNGGSRSSSGERRRLRRVIRGRELFVPDRLFADLWMPESRRGRLQMILFCGSTQHLCGWLDLMPAVIGAVSARGVRHERPPALVRPPVGTYGPLPSAGARVRYSCSWRMTIEPSPTADATRLTEPCRASPAANTPGMLVSNG
jgi:hypothetical protein